MVPTVRAAQGIARRSPSDADKSATFSGVRQGRDRREGESVRHSYRSGKDGHPRLRKREVLALPRAREMLEGEDSPCRR